MTKTEETVQSIRRILNARSVAVVGASSDPTKFGYMTLDSIIKGGYEGKIYPINPKGGELFGLTAYPSLKDVPGPIDMVVVVVPVKLVAGVLREAAELKVPGAVIMTAGFREAGRSDLEEEIKSIARQSNMRLMGPNIQGINYLPNKLCAMFFPVVKTRGPLAVISQSGSVTAGLAEWAAYEELGISAAINLGNQADLCESDYLEFFATDENTKSIVMYSEGVKDGKRFLKTVKQVALKKPIIILKGGKTAAGQKSAASHTGSLAGSNEVFKAACRQFGVVYTEDLETAYDCAKALATIKPPKGNRVLIISTSGGANTLGVDEAGVRGVVVPPLPQEFVQQLKQMELSPLATLSNPLDLANISVEHFRKVVLLADQLNVADIILLNFADPVVGSVELAKFLAANIKARLAVCFFGGGEEEKVGRVEIQRAGIPVFPAPERAMRGLAASVWVSRYPQTYGKETVEKPPADKEMHVASEESQKFIPETEAIKILQQYKISYPKYGFARNPEEAGKIANQLGFPVVLKIVSPQVSHKSDVGGVLVGLKNTEEVASGFKKIQERLKTAVPNASMEGVLVCKQAPDGLDIIIGALEDPVFGPTIMFGLGGIFTEILKDVSFRIAPLEKRDAEEMIREVKGYPLLMGIRGQKAYDVEQLTNLLLSVSRLVVENSNIKELDLNPVRLFESGLMALDVRLMKKKE